VVGVAFALLVPLRLGSALTVPIRPRLVEESGQRSKLCVAAPLIAAVRGTSRTRAC
jgi:hypothetical protein